MKVRRLWGIAVLFAALALLTAGCDGDEAVSIVKPPRTPVVTSTHTATPTVAVPTNTNTATLTATAAINTATPTTTSTRPPATETPTSGATLDTPTPTASATATETATPAGGGALGVRALTVMRPGSSLNTSAVSGIDISLDPWLSATLQLEAGAPDGAGVASLELLEDVLIGVRVLDNSVACFKLFAAGSAGTVACDGGVPQSVLVTQDSNEDQSPGPLMTLTGQGDASPPGSASLTLLRSAVNLPTGSEPSDCEQASFSVTEPAAFTTATGTGTVFNAVQSGGTITIVKMGAPFDCADWTNANGPGTLVNPIIALDIVIGDAANTLILAGQQSQ